MRVTSCSSASAPQAAPTCRQAPARAVPRQNKCASVKGNNVAIAETTALSYPTVPCGDVFSNQSGTRSSSGILTSASPRCLPNHVAIILDGNQRWAKKRGLAAYEGHQVCNARFSERCIRSSRCQGLRAPEEHVSALFYIWNACVTVTRS